MADLHPAQDPARSRDPRDPVAASSSMLAEISGMDRVSLQPGVRVGRDLDQRGHDPRLARVARRGRPARRGHHHDLQPPLERGRGQGRRVQGHHALPRRGRIPRPRRAPGGGLRAHRRAPDHQPRGHRHLQPADRGVRRRRPRGRRPVLLRPGQRQRHPGHHPGPRGRVRRLPLQPAQDVLDAACLRRAGGGCRGRDRAMAPFLPRPVIERDGEQFVLRRRPAAVDREGRGPGSAWCPTWSGPTPG